jgi:hypothetical protein
MTPIDRIIMWFARPKRCAICLAPAEWDGLYCSDEHAAEWQKIYSL